MRWFFLVSCSVLASCGYLDPHAEAKQAVADQMKDPDTVKFKDVFKGKSAVCGKVNAKNSYGAYAGYQSFIYRNRKVLLEATESAPLGSTESLIEASSSLQFTMDWIDHC